MLSAKAKSCAAVPILVRPTPAAGHNNKRQCVALCWRLADRWLAIDLEIVQLGK